MSKTQQVDVPALRAKSLCDSGGDMQFLPHKGCPVLAMLKALLFPKYSYKLVFNSSAGSMD